MDGYDSFEKIGQFIFDPSFWVNVHLKLPSTLEANILLTPKP